LRKHGYEFDTHQKKFDILKSRERCLVLNARVGANRVRAGFSPPAPTPHSKRVRTMLFLESFKTPLNF
jgi:hypothetical protein